METIIRVEKNRQNPYVMIRNSVFEDPLISWKAKGMMGYFLSRPDNWTILLHDLVNRSPDGRDKVYSGLAELKQRGYLAYVPDRDPKGKIIRGRYIVYEVPQKPMKEIPGMMGRENPLPDFPDQGEPLPENPDRENPTLLITDKEPITDQALSTETEPSTPSESQALTALPSDTALTATESPAGAIAPAIQPFFATLPPVDEPPSPAPSVEEAKPAVGTVTLQVSDPSIPSPVSDAKQLANRLKQRLQERGVTVFPRDWHLKAQTSAKRLLRALSMTEAEQLMDWSLAHPFWGSKVTQMYRLEALASEWQLAKGGLSNGKYRAPASLAAGRHDDSGALDALVVRADATATV